jgi:hypothetical protein
MLFCLKQQIERGDKDVHLRAVKLRDEMRKKGNTDFANKLDRMLNKYYNEQTR